MVATKKSVGDFNKFADKFEKSFGVGTLIAARDQNPYEIVSTGALGLDHACGVGGLVEGRLIEIWGPDGVGKSTLSMMIVSEAQKKYPGKRTAWIDMEQVFDGPWAEAHDVDIDNLVLFSPNSAEDVADAMKEIITSGLFSVVVLDSIGAMIPEAEKEKDADKAVMAIQAKIVTRMVKIAAVEAHKTGTIPVLINQVRANLGYGADTTTGGGWALKHATTMKFKLSRTSTNPFQVRSGGEVITVGHEIKVRLERNKVAPPYRDATLVLFNQPSKFGPVGLDKVDEAVSLGIRLGVIKQGGAFYTLDGEFEKVKSRDSVIELFREKPELVDKVRKRVLALTAEEIIIDDIEGDLADLSEVAE